MVSQIPLDYGEFEHCQGGGSPFFVTHPLHPAAVSLHGVWTIISGTDLQSGEPVIIDGGFNLPDETPVLIETAEQASPAESRR